MPHPADFWKKMTGLLAVSMAPLFPEVGGRAPDHSMSVCERGEWEGPEEEDWVGRPVLSWSRQP